MNEQGKYPEQANRNPLKRIQKSILQIFIPEKTTTQLSDQPVVIARDAIRRHFKDGQRDNFAELIIISKAREAIGKMPSGKRGVIIGSGPNSANWIQKGWSTLDIDKKSGASIIGNANELSNYYQPDSQDFVLAEFVTFDNEKKKGVGPQRLIEEAKKVLRKGGILIIQSAHIEGEPLSSLPNRYNYQQIIYQNGFKTITELDRIHRPDHTYLEQEVAYYGLKK